MGSRIRIDLKRVITSSTVTIISIAVVSLAYRGEVNAYKSRVVLNSQEQNIRDTFYGLQTEVINASIVDPTYKLNSAIALVQNGFTQEGLRALQEVYSSDSRNLDAIRFLALTHESLNQISDAIYYRIEMAKYDQWNAENYLELGKNYKKQGDFVNSKNMLLKILSFAPYDPIASQAKIDLGS